MQAAEFSLFIQQQHLEAKFSKGGEKMATAIVSHSCPLSLPLSLSLASSVALCKKSKLVERANGNENNEREEKTGHTLLASD